VRSSITVRQTKTVRAAIAAIPEHDWVDIAYQPGGVAQVLRGALVGDGSGIAAGDARGPSGWDGCGRGGDRVWM
jgi:hypothetical protein